MASDARYWRTMTVAGAAMGERATWRSGVLTERNLVL
jgi:hypothetical protein